MSKPLRLLLLEDSAEDTQRLREALTDGGFQPRITRAVDEDAFRSALGQGEWDAIICDNDLARSGGWDVLAVVREASSDLPFILVSRSMDLDTAAEAIADGAHDFIEKTDLSRISLSIMRELKAAENRVATNATLENLRESEASAREFAELLPEAVYECDPDGNLTFSNAAAFEAVGITEEDFQHGATVFDFIDPSDHDRVRENVGAIIGGVKSGETGEYTFVRKDGSKFPARIRSQPFYRDGKPAGLRGVIIDISDQKNQEEELRKSRDEAERREEAASRKWLHAVNNVQFALSLFDAEDRIVEWNDKFGAGVFDAGWLKVGRSFEEILRELVDKACPDEAVGREEDWIQDRLAHRRNPVKPFELHTRGHVLSIDEHRMPDGGILEIANDITERKQAETELSHTRTTLETVLSLAPVVLWSTDKDGRFTLSRGAGLKALGLEQDQIVGQSLLDVYRDHPDIIETAKAALGGQEIKATHTIGNLVFEAHYRPLTSASGQVTGLVGVALDVTEEAEARQALRASEQRLRAILDNSPAAIFLTDMDGRLILVNKAHMERHNHSAEEVLGKTASEIFGKDLADQILSFEQRVLGGDGPSAEEELLVEETDTGERRVFLVNRFPIPGPDGKIVGIGGISTDVTLQKQAEEDLRRSRDELEQRVAARTRELHERETILSALVDNSTSSIDLKDADGRFELINKTFEKWHCLRSDKVVNRLPDEVFDEDVSEAVNERHRKVVETAQAQVFELHLQFADGITRHTLLTKFPVFDLEGRVIKVGSIATDVTESKNAEIALRESEERFRAVLENTENAVALRDREGRVLMANQAFCRNRKKPYEEIAGKTFEELYPPAHAALLMAQHQQVLETGQSESFEHPLLESPQEGRTILATRFPVRNVDGEIIAVGTIATDITERTVMESALRESEERFRTFIDNSMTGISMLDCDGHFVIANQETADRLANGRVGDVIGKTAYDLLPAKHATEFSEQNRHVVETGESLHIPFERVESDGSVHSYLAHKFPVRDAKGKIVGVGVISTDITDVKRAEAAARETDARFRSFIENSPTSIAVLDRDGRYVVVNQELVERFKVNSQDDIIGKTVSDFFPPEQAAEYSKQDQRILETGVSEQVSYEIRHDDGGTHAYLAQKFPIRDGDGEIVGLGIVSTDITELRQAEAAVREREARFRSFIDNSPAYISMMDRDRVFILASQKLIEERAGGDPDRILGKTIFDYFPPDMAAKFDEQDQRILRTGEPEEVSYDMPNPDGTEQSFLAVKFPVRAADGEITGMGVVTTDITATKKAETAIREREELFRAFIDNTPASISLTDRDGHFIATNYEFNRRADEMLHGEGRIETVFDLFPREMAEEFDRDDKAVMQTGKTIERPFDLVHPNGLKHYYHTVKFPIRDSAGSISGVGIITTEETERKQAEEAVQETARLLQAVLDNSPTAISLKNTDGKLILVNEQWRRQYGLSDEDALGKSLMELFPYDIAVVLQDHDKRVLETGVGTEFEMELPGPDGLPETDIVVKFPITGSDGRITGVGSIGTNITERKRAEEALRWSERDLRGILDNMVDTFFRTDREGRIMMISPSVTNLLGVTPEEALGRRFDEFVAVPNAMPNLYELVVSGSDETTGHEIRMVRQDGDEVWVLTTARKFVDEDGEAAGIEGVAHDITMRKRAEEALAESEERFRDFAEASSDWMWETDADGRFSYISERIVDVLGIKPGQILGKNRDDLANDGQVNADWSRYRRQIDQKKPFRDFQYEATGSDGETRTLRISGLPRFAEDGTFLGYRGTGNDITESLATERREAQTRQRFLDAIETVPVGFALYDAEDRLVLWNRLYENFSTADTHLRVGSTFEEVVRSNVVSNPIPDADGREEEWIANRLAHYENPTGPLVLKRGEKWLQIREHKTPDGNTLLIVVDISDIRRAEESLRESERQLRAILDNIPDLAWLKDSEHRFITVNNVFSQSCGLSLDELIGKTDLEIWPKELGHLYFADDQEVVETGKRKRIEEQVQRADGDLIWVETIKAPVLDEHGQVVGSVGTARDITERRTAEQELRKLSAAVEQSPAAIFIMDPAGTIEYANPKFCETTGYALDEVIGQTPELLRTDYVEPGQFEKMWQAITTGQEWRGEMRNRKKSGDHFWTSVAISPITDASGKISHLLSIAEDTTEKRRMDEQLRHAQKLEAVGTLAGGVAHDFNNILTGVLGHCYIAVEKLDKENQVQFNLDQIRVASNRAKDLVQQLLAFSRRREATLKPVKLHGIVDEAVKLVHASIRSVIKIHWNVDENAGTVMADPTQIHQVLLNLCGNAADAIGDEAGTIDVSVTRVVSDGPIAVIGTDLPPGHYARLRISDSGCGMDVYTQSRAFDPFFTTKPVGSGTGLGLAAVHGIVQDHSGGIQLESKPGEGTTFNVYLPCVDVEEAMSEPKLETDFSGSECILLVDDERMVLQSIGPYLEHFGYRVEPFTTPTAALASFESRPDQFDLLVTDQVMPNMTGDVLARRVRALRPDLPVILCTGYAARADKNSGDKLEVDRIVGKPVEPSELGRIIRSILDERA